MAEVDLATPAERAKALLSKMDLDFFDVYALYSRSLNVNILGRGIQEARARTDLGIGVRAFKNKGLGVAFSQSLDRKDIDETVSRAVGFCRVAQPDPHFKGIPGPSKAPEVPGLCDPEVVELTLDEAAEMAKRMLDAEEGVLPGAMSRGGVSAHYAAGFLTTSTGVSISSATTGVSAFIAPTYRRGDDIGSSYEFDYAVSLAELDFEEIGKKAAKKAVEQFGSERVESGSMPLILAPETASSMVFGLLEAISGESAAKGRTFASSLLGKQVAPEVLEVDDDGSIPGAISSSTYDGEGVPRRPTKVLAGGRIMTFLHNSYSAGIAGTETTGHAERGGYGGYVGAGPTNVRVKPGESSLEEMVKETRRGVLVTHASFFPNLVSGEFSTTVDQGFLIENGERKSPVKNAMVGGHILELFGKIESVSKEGRTIGKGHFFPAIKVSQAKIAGR